MAQITPRDRSWADLRRFMRKVDKVTDSASFRLFEPIWGKQRSKDEKTPLETGETRA